MNLTDNETMQALECCGTDMNCHRCPAKEDENGCIRKACQNALDLINRLQADKEALIAGQETLQKALAKKSIEAEWWREELVFVREERLQDLTDGVKYTMKRVYRFLTQRENWNELKDQWLVNGECDWLKHKLDNLAKEMVDESNG